MMMMMMMMMMMGARLLSPKRSKCYENTDRFRRLLKHQNKHRLRTIPKPSS